MRSICFYFQVHQPVRLRTYRFFDIGANHNYYDEYQNKFIMKRVAEKSYLPMNQLLLDLIKEHGKSFKVSFSISGIAMEQFAMYTPEVLESFQKLAKTGCVEFLAETYAHSLAALRSRREFEEQVKLQKTMIENYFGQTPKVFRNTELVYSNEIGAMVSDMGYKTMLTEGAKHILGWKSPNFIYNGASNPELNLLLKNYRLSDDIAFRFSDRGWAEWPLTTEKFVGWLNEVDPKQEVINLFMDYETFGEHQWEETGIFEFMQALPGQVLTKTKFSFNTPSEISAKLSPVAAIDVPHPISWADEERDLTAWLGNELQDDAFECLYAIENKVRACNDKDIQRDWQYLQASDHFYYMCTKWFTDGDVHNYFNPYPSPYEAYINYMNVIADFSARVEQSTDTSGYQKMKEVGEDLGEEFRKQARKISEEAKTIQSKARKSWDESKVRDLTLDDIVQLSKAEIKEIARKMNVDDMNKVLNQASDDVRNKIIPNLTKTAQKKYAEFETEVKKIKKSDLKEAREKIENEIKDLFRKKK